jgi:hypothetical protein
LFAVFHAVRGAPERRNVVRSYRGFSDANQVDRRRPTSASSAWLSTKEPPPGTLMPTTTRIRSEAGDENQSPIHFPRVALSVLSFIARIDAAYSSTLSLYVIVTASVARCISTIQPIALSIASGPAITSLPQKLGSTRVANVHKVLKTWSGRRDSNPRVQLGNMSVDCK